QDLAAQVVEVPAEGGQTEVYGIEHDLNRDEHQDDVAPGQESEHSDPKEDSAQSQNRAHWPNHDPAALLPARTTAPMMAARSNREAISKGNANGPKSAMPIAERPPWGGPSAATRVDAGATPAPARVNQPKVAKQSRTAAEPPRPARRAASQQRCRRSVWRPRTR